MPAFDDEEDDLSFIQRHRGVVIGGVALVLGGVGFLGYKALSGHHTSAPRNEMVSISLPPPPPPPPKPQPTPQQTPPPEEQKQEQKMEEQAPVQEEKKQEAPKDKPPDAPAPLGTGITGPSGGPDLGLGSGIGGGGGYGSGGGGGTKYGWYATQVQSKIRDAVSSNPLTRRATMNVVVRIWPDANGRIGKVHVSGSTGDPKVDAALRDEVLNGLQIGDAPPSDMPLPIVMRLSAQRPH